MSVNQIKSIFTGVASQGAEAKKSVDTCASQLIKKCFPEALTAPISDKWFDGTQGNNATRPGKSLYEFIGSGKGQIAAHLAKLPITLGVLPTRALAIGALTLVNLTSRSMPKTSLSMPKSDKWIENEYEEM